MIPETIRRAQAGDEQAFAELYHQHHKRVYGICLKMTQNTATAEDYTQDTFLQVFRMIKGFRGDAAFTTWIHRMTVNIVLMNYRKRNRRLVTIPLEIPTTDGADVTAPWLVSKLDDALEYAPERIAIERAIDELPRCMKRIFVMKYVEGYEHNEIASALGCSMGNSKSQSHKARHKIARSLRPKRFRR